MHKVNYRTPILEHFLNPLKSCFQAYSQKFSLNKFLQIFSVGLNVLRLTTLYGHCLPSVWIPTQRLPWAAADTDTTYLDHWGPLCCSGPSLYRFSFLDLPLALYSEMCPWASLTGTSAYSCAILHNCAGCSGHKGTSRGHTCGLMSSMKCELVP